MVVFLQVYSFTLSPSLPYDIYQIYKYIFYVCNIPNLDPWINQNNDYEDTATKTISKFETIVQAADKNSEQFGDLHERIDSGDPSVKYAFKMVQRAEDHKAENIPELQEG